MDQSPLSTCLYHSTQASFHMALTRITMWTIGMTFKPSAPILFNSRTFSYPGLFRLDLTTKVAHDVSDNALGDGHPRCPVSHPFS